MKILALNGSPRKNGHSKALLKLFSKTAVENGHEVDVFDSYQHNVKGCTACGACKKSDHTLCAVQDDFQQLLDKIKDADCLIFASPVYFGTISGELKCVLDRFYCFFSQQFGVRDIKGKKFITMTVSGAPPESFADVSEYLKHWFGDFCKMKCHGEVIAGGTSKGAISDQAAIEDHVQNLAKTL